MTSNNLESQISQYLVRFPDSSAREIAKGLKEEKSEVNSILYSKKNVLFIMSATSPPRWSVIQASQQKIKLPTANFKVLKTSEPIHIDFQGGDWKITITISDLSRNDPAVSLERTGPNSALIRVSSSVIGETEVDSENFPSAALALAASALAWEIAVQSDAVLEENFDFALALRDIYHSFGAHQLRSKKSTE